MAKDNPSGKTRKFNSMLAGNEKTGRLYANNGERREGNARKQDFDRRTESEMWSDVRSLRIDSIVEKAAILSPRREHETRLSDP